MSLEVLYDPLPIGRMGVDKSTQEVVIARDFSCFALMLEEYISYGAVNICLPKSYLEMQVLEEMPRILRERIRLLDDIKEDEATRRIFYQLRKEFDLEILEDELHLKRNKDLPINFFEDIDSVHQSFKKLALGFNHGVQIDINASSAVSVVRRLRGKSTDPQTRVVLAQLESIFRSYGQIEFKAPALAKGGNAPQELISIFDKLVNESTYLEYSDSMVNLNDPSTRERALGRIREIGQSIKSSDTVRNGWDITSKVITACSGIPIPDASILSTLDSERHLPMLTDLSEAKRDALALWKDSPLSEVPLAKNGEPIENENIIWLPPLKSMKVHTPYNENKVSFGTVGELLTVLKEYQAGMPPEQKV